MDFLTTYTLPANRPLNIHHISAHFEELKAEIHNESCYIMALSETFLVSNTPTSMYDINNFTFLLHEQADIQSGGIGFYHRDHYK